jgi:hypothetical protein
LDKESSDFIDAWWSGEELKEWHSFKRVSAFSLYPFVLLEDGIIEVQLILGIYFS